ncbi:MAG: hypothetical protein ACI9N1_000659 [Flavobacteriales bacterium]|jgi:hypothetical protein
MGGCRLWSITDEMVNEYLERHRTDANDSTNFILE